MEKGMWLVEKEKGSRTRKGSGKVDRGCGLLVSRGFFGSQRRFLYRKIPLGVFVGTAQFQVPSFWHL